tara:strand:+ start:2119 stop:2364 length:246 start_codon:yes stop_codon:yes gene_type:complete
MSKCLAILVGICITFGESVVAESTIEKDLDQAIVYMSKAVKQADKGNFILGDPYAVCPGQKPEPIGDRNGCDIPAFSCRCF